MMNGVSAASPRSSMLRVAGPDETNLLGHARFERDHCTARRHPRTPEKAADQTKLWRILDNTQYSGRELCYTYDFGDKWEHYVCKSARSEATSTFSCMGGVGHCPVERMNIEPAVKGTEIKAAYWSKKPSEAQEKTMKWYETEATNGDSLGLRDGRENHFDTTEVNARLVEAGL